MREILFKGKTIEIINDTPKWVEGSLNHIPEHKTKDQKAILFETCSIRDIYNTSNIHKVDPKTVCQYIWTNDKNGVKVFENDVLVRRNKDDNNIIDAVYIIKWNDLQAKYYVKYYNINNEDNKTEYHTIDFNLQTFAFSFSDLEIYGNLYDEEDCFNKLFSK